MVIQLATLPPSLLQQLPFTLIYGKTELQYNDLPSDIKLILNDYIINKHSTHQLSGVYDFKSTLSEFGDFQEITNLTDLILEYIKNWLKIRKGQYPFDPTFGTAIYDVLHTKDTSYRKILLKNELKILKNLVRSEFGQTFVVEKQAVTNIPKETHTEYLLELQIKVLGRTVSISTSSSN